MSGDLLDGLVTDARASLERARRAVPPDFAAVLAKARAEQPDLPAMPPSLDDADDEPGADVVDIRQRPRTAAGPDPVDDLVAGARGSIERMIDARRLRPIPPMPRPAAPRRRLAMVVGAAGLLAAALVATFAGIRWVEQAQRLEDEAAREQAAQVGQAQPDAPADVVDVVVEPERPRARPVAPPPEAEPQLAIEPESEIVASPERPSKPAVEPDRLRALSEQARTLWRAGDRTGAEAKFQQVVNQGGRSSLAELAWGDLFTLARQQGDDARLAKRWRSYLARFPKGRYADDARAGLCRRAGDGGECWRDYLRDFPRGSYRAEAGANIEGR